ncbi:MAG: NAD-dependent epimerase/dehydratase family protein [Bdellovibrio sp.]|nr:NAD-dependent epimerase/dehydratase family protein [Bdellovibrio sp.]
MKVLVTGGGGFLGKRIVTMLQKEGHKVSSLSRQHYPELEAMHVECHQVDLGDELGLKAALNGVDAVIHTAAKVGVFGRYEDFYKTNVTGTQTLIKAMKEQSVSYLVFTSSPSVVFGHEDLCGADETVAYPKKYLNHYSATKALAEKYVIQEGRKKDSIKTVSLRPHLILGPGDKNLFPRLLKAHIQGRLKKVGNGENLVDIIHVDNAAKAHLLALEKLVQGRPISGESYFLGQESPVNLWRFLNDIFVEIGVGPIEKSIPFSLAYNAGHIFEKVYSFQGRFEEDPPMTRFVALQLAKGHYFSQKKAQKDLDYYPFVNIAQLKSELVAH